MTILNISVVINTYNRAASLRNTLSSFRWQNYPLFEIVVVNGPSTDDTVNVLEEYADSVKVVSCPVANISVSRNIGISHAAGEIVAFIDDDGIPCPHWLQGLSRQYVNSDVGGVGGFVWDHTGMAYQTRYVACDRFGEARFFDTFNPSDQFSFPSAEWYPSLMGVNSSFRKCALLEIGGFNEVYAYYLDETDVCLRIIDSGYKIVFTPDANVHHKYLSSHIRDTKRITRNFYPTIKSKTNFIMTHGAAANGRACAENRISGWISERKIEIDLGYFFRDYTKNERQQALHEIDKAYEGGMCRAGFICDNLNPATSGMLKPFPALKSKLRIVFISADYPPMANGGIGTFMKALSIGLAKLGNEVHVITRTSTAETLDFIEGVWVHRIKSRIYESTFTLNGKTIELPPAIKDWAGTAKERVEFICAEFNKVDVVVSPIWDLEGCIAMSSSEWKSVIMLQTTYALSVDTHPTWTSDQHYFENFIMKMISAEKALLELPPVLISISDGLIDAMEAAYEIKMNRLNIVTVPLGVHDYMIPSLPLGEDFVRGLFVGRLELRKGADVLFDILPELFDLLPYLTFDVVGDDSIPVYGSKTLMDNYRDSLMSYINQGRLRVHGKIEDMNLPKFYNECDLFVAPSRFESFGLILVEAMSCGKPVIACRAGGMVEVVGDAGLLAEPGDKMTLKEHIFTLASNKELRQRFGQQARSRYEKLFSVDLMARNISTILEGAINDNLV